MNYTMPGFHKCFCAVFCFLLAAGLGRVVHADEFIGPLAGWANLNASYPLLAGDADDTRRIQAALNDLGTGGHARVLYIPAGTYNISASLKMTGRDGVSILGADPATTVIQWTGTSAPDFHGAMIAVNGCWFSRYGRLTWNGNNVAQTAWLDYWDGNLDPGSPTFFPTHNEHADEVFQNVGYGIRVGLNMPQASHNYGDAETPVLRCKFQNCSIAGFCAQDPNVLDWFLWYCTFDHCGRGATNNPPTGGSGGFHVYNSVFRSSSVADVSVNNTGYFSMRGNYSLGSRQFFNAAWQGGNSARVTLQKNTILDTTSPVSIEVSNAGPLMLIDNVIRSAPGQTGPGVTVGVDTGRDDTISLGNTFTVTSPIATGASTPGRIRLVFDSANSDKTVSYGDINVSEPVLPGTLPDNHRKIYEASATADSTEIQSLIQTAMADERKKGGRPRPVVHIPGGMHAVTSTITFPAGSDVQLVGDGYGLSSATNLTWAGPAGGTVLTLASPSRVTLRDFAVSGSGAATGIQTYVGDKAGDRVFVEGSDVSDSTAAGLLYNNLGSTVLELHDFYHSSNAGISVSVIGDNVGKGPGRVDLFGGDGSSNTGLSYDVKNKGRLMVQDAWYEAHNLNGTVDPSFHAPRFMSLSGSGTFTLQGGHIAAVTEPGVPVISVGKFAGNASFIGLTLAPNYGSHAPVSPLTVQSTAVSTTDVLVLGVMGDAPNWLANFSPSSQIAFLNNKLPAPDGGSQQFPDQGHKEDAFLERMLYQTRHEYPAAAPLRTEPAGSSDVRFYRIRSSGGGSGSPIACCLRIDKAP